MTTHECRSRACPLCEKGADTLERAMEIVEETPTHTDLSQVRDGIHAFLERYPEAFILPAEEKGPLRTWGASFIKDPETEYTQFWTVPLQAHVESKAIVE